MNNDQFILSMIAEGRLKVEPEAGYVYSTLSNTPNKPLGSLTRKGYLRTEISYRGNQVMLLIHRVVWVSVYGPLPEDKQINHKNTIKIENGIENLEAVTQLENMRHAKSRGLAKGGWRGALHNDKGQFVGKNKVGRLLDGKIWEYP